MSLRKYKNILIKYLLSSLKWTLLSVVQMFATKEKFENKLNPVKIIQKQIIQNTL